MYYIVGKYKIPNSEKYYFGYLASDIESGGYPCFASLNSKDANIREFNTVEEAVENWEKEKKYLNYKNIQDVEVIKMALHCFKKLH